MNCFTSAVSASLRSWPKPGMRWNCRFRAPSCHSVASVALPRLTSSTGSASPCARKNAMSLAADDTRARPPRYSSRMGKYDESETTPPMATPSSACTAHVSATAPPCEKPPRMMRFAGTPSRRSRRTMPLMYSADATMLSRSSHMFAGSSVFMSYHAGSGRPKLIVTGRVGATGKIHCTLLKGESSNMLSMPFAAPPSPCSKITTARRSLPLIGPSTTGSGYSTRPRRTSSSRASTRNASSAPAERAGRHDATARIRATAAHARRDREDHTNIASVAQVVPSAPARRRAGRVMRELRFLGCSGIRCWEKRETRAA